MFKAKAGEIMSDGKVIIETDLDSKGLEKGIDNIGSIATKGSKIAVGAIAAIGTAITGMAALSVSAGSKFETSLAKASTMFGQTKVNTDLLNEKILTLSNSTGLAATEIGDSLYNALSAGIPATEDMSEAMDYMEKSARLAKAGFTDIDTAVTATAKVLNAYKMDVSETDKVHKVLMQTQNNGITTVGELGAVLAQVTPTAAAMNVSFEQVGAALANMTAQGTPTAQATTQLNSLFAELGKQGTNAQKALMKATEGTAYAGKGFKELMGEGVPLNEVLDLMGINANASDQELLDLFGSLEAGKAALALSGVNAETFTKNLTAMSTETDVVCSAYEKMSDTLASKTDVLKSEFTNLGIRIYDKLEAPLKKAADSGIEAIDALGVSFSEGDLSGSIDKIAEGFGNLITKLVEGVENWLPKVLDLIVWLAEHSTELTGVILGLAGAILVFKGYMIALSVIGTVTTLIKAFRAGTLKATLAQMGLNVAMLANPFTWIAVAIAALVGGIIYLWTTNEGFRNAIIGIWESIKSAGEACWGWLVKFFTEDIPNAWNSVVEFFTGIPQWFSDLWTTVKQGFIDGWNAIWDWLSNAVSSYIDGLISFWSTLPEKIGYCLGYALGTIVKWGMSVWDFITITIPSIITDIVTYFSELPGRIQAWLLQSIADIVAWGTNVYNTSVDWISSAIDSIISYFSALPGRIWAWLCEAVNNIISWGSNMYNAGVQAASDLVDSIISTISALPGQVWDIGVNIVEGLWNGITSMGSWIGDKVSGFFGGIVNGAKKALGIHSPSRVFRDQVGKYMAQGVGVGFEDETENIQGDMQNNLSDLTSKMTATVNYETSKTSRGISTNANLKADTRTESNDSIDSDIKDGDIFIIKNYMDSDEISEYTYKKANGKFALATKRVR